MKPIVKSLNLSSATLIKKSRDDYISHVASESFAGLNDIIEPPFDPEALKTLRYSSIYHRKCLKAKAVDVTMSGWQIQTDNEGTSQNQSKLKTLFKDYSFETTFQKALEDYGTYGYAALELLQSSKGEMGGFKHIRSNTIRICKDGLRAVQQVSTQTIYFKIAGTGEDQDLNYKTGAWMTPESSPEDKATLIIWIGDSSPDSDYYGEPDYISALLTILSDEYLREFNNNSFITNGIPNYLITIAGDFDTEADEDGNTFEESIEEQILDLQNKPGTAVVFTIPSNNPENKIDIQVTKISEEQQEASFESFRQSNRDEILAAHEVPPGRLGIVNDGALAGSVDIERNKLYNSKTVKPLQRKIENLINTIIIEEIMEITDCYFEYKTLDTRDIPSELEIALKLYNTGAMKPIELREQFGDIFNLAIDVDEIPIIDYNPELDEFYINGQPLTFNDATPEAVDEVKEIIKSIDGGIAELIKS